MLSAAPVPGFGSRWGGRLLVVATAWLVMLGTLVPIAIPGFGAWLPVHEHRTLAGFVPPHTHAYDRQANHSAGASCEAADHSHTSAPEARIVCTTTDDISSGSFAVLVPDAPVSLPGVPAAAGSGAANAPGLPADPHAAVVTPPPRP